MKVLLLDVLLSVIHQIQICKLSQLQEIVNNNNEWYFVSYFQAVSDVQEGMSHMLASMATRYILESD